jgi:hypothetical protein
MWPVTVASIVVQGSWCPDCARLGNVGEVYVRAILEETFGKPFPSVQPDWLMGEKGRALELDGYCEELALAFEYQGPHHGSDPAVQRNDRLKRQVCMRLGITLVEVAATNKPYPPESLLPLVRDGLREAGRFEEPRLPARMPIPSQLAEGRRLAAARSGQMLTECYDGGPLRWKCEVPIHPEWAAELWRIRNGHWCKYCAPSAPLDLEALRKWGRGVGLELLDEEYHGAQANHSWRCLDCGRTEPRVKGNIEQSIKKGLSACKRCAGTDRAVSLEAVADCARSRGWTVVSTAYESATAEMDFRCSAGHPNSMSWNRMQQGGGCREMGCGDASGYGRWRRPAA